jgi:hypothetical protein
MKRGPQHADERAYRGSDKAYDCFPAQWAFTNICRWVQQQKAKRSLDEAIKKYQQRR